MKTQKPKSLKTGDLVGIISPASSPEDLTRIEKGVTYFEKLGYNVVVGKNVGKYRGYLAGSDDERVEDLHEMFENEQVRAILCLRGGYGTPRLLNKIDYNLIEKNPKILVGYSDITALQLAFFQKAHLVTFAGPMVAVDFHGEINRYTEENFWRALTSTKKLDKVTLPENEMFETFRKGKCEGEILGGNLSLITSLIGTSYFPKMKNRILFLEEVEEKPYRVDRMLNQLALTGVLQKVEGILLGEFTDCEETKNRSLALEEVFNDYFGKLKIPVIKNFPHGHRKANFTLPFGVKTKLNADKSYIEFLEAAVI